MLTIETLAAGDRHDWERLFRAYIDFYNRTLPDERYERSWQQFQEDERIHARGAWLDGRLVGIVHFLRHPHTNAEDVCYLQDLFTEPSVRGQGVGRALIAYVADWARERGCSRVYWHTQASNEQARALYDQVAEHRGFIVYHLDL